MGVAGWGPRCAVPQPALLYSSFLHPPPSLLLSLSRLADRLVDLAPGRPLSSSDADRSPLYLTILWSIVIVRVIQILSPPSVIWPPPAIFPALSR